MGNSILRYKNGKPENDVQMSYTSRTRIVIVFK